MTARPKLALHGGTPVRQKMLPYGRHVLDASDIEAVTRVLRSDWLTGGPEVAAFEAELAEYVGAVHAVAFSSGTAALHGAYVAAGLGPGDEAITSPITFCATANALLHAGAVPVFADVDARTLSLDPAAVARRITPRTRALIPVDYAGHPAQLDALRDLARAHGLALIEDAAHALGARVGQRKVGSLADLTVFSFHAVKHVACGEGGMVTTDDDAMAVRLRRFRNHGLSSEARDRKDGARWAYDLLEAGCNYRLTDIAAALGRSQLARLPANLARRRGIAARYAEAFAGCAAITTLPAPAAATSAWHIYPVRFDLDALGADRDALIAALRAEGIGVNVHYVPVSGLTLYRERGYRVEDTPRAVAESARLVTLPLFHGMTDADADDVIAAVHKVVGWYGGRCGLAD